MLCPPGPYLGPYLEDVEYWHFGMSLVILFVEFVFLGNILIYNILLTFWLSQWVKGSIQHMYDYIGD